MRYEEALGLIEVGLELWKKSIEGRDKDSYMVSYMYFVGLLNGRISEVYYIENLCTTVSKVVYEVNSVQTEAEIFLDHMVKSGYVVLADSVH
jgi:hypothetical protein